MKDDPTIGLYGIGGAYNYGCEAIIRGTENILRKIWPEVNIRYASLNPQDDINRLEGCNIDIIPREELNSNYKLYYGYLSYKLKLKSYIENLNWINDCDAILSIGGDLYTLPPNYKDKRFIGYYNNLVHFGELARNRTKYIIWGASIGPFENSPKAKKIFINHLNKVDLITSREPECTHYLKKIGIFNNVISCADPAFVVDGSNKLDSNNDTLCIGINLSPLSLHHSFKNEYDDKISKQVRIIEGIVEFFNAEVILIPHVINEQNDIDNDFLYLNYIYSKLSDKFIDNVHIVNKDIGFLGIKDIISKCDVVIASRMHCGINAVSAGVPTIFLSYSQKAVGMSNYIYGNNKWLVQLNNLEDLIKILNRMLLNKVALDSFLKKRIEKIKLDAYAPEKRIKSLLNTFK